MSKVEVAKEPLWHIRERQWRQMQKDVEQKRKKKAKPLPYHDVEQSDSPIPRRAWRGLIKKTVAQKVAASTLCARCHLPMGCAMRIGGVMQRCHCKKKETS